MREGFRFRGLGHAFVLCYIHRGESIHVCMYVCINRVYEAIRLERFFWIIIVLHDALISFVDRDTGRKRGC
jgi:hypothetical protein